MLGTLRRATSAAGLAPTKRPARLARLPAARAAARGLQEELDDCGRHLQQSEHAQLGADKVLFDGELVPLVRG